jgi:hypothetical protein
MLQQPRKALDGGCHPGRSFRGCNNPQRLDRGSAMQLMFLGKDSQPNQSPTLYATDRDSYIVQGWIVTAPEILVMIAVADDQTIVEVPAKLMTYLTKDGLSSKVANLAHPIVHVTAAGNYIVMGVRVTDREALGQMDIPDHETCVEVPKSAVAALLVGG